MKRFVTILVVLGALGFLGYKIWDLAWNRPPTLKEAPSRFKYADTFRHVHDVVYRNVLDHARQIAAFGSRQTGQPGCSLTVQYVRSRLEAMGLEVTSKSCPATVPVEETCSVTITRGNSPEAERLPAHVLMPNCVQTSPTPPDGLRGPLAYLGSGAAADWDGREVRDAIVVLEFNSGEAWLRAIGRGAKAVVFLEPRQTTTREADRKYIDSLPLRATRVYVWGDAAATLRERADRNRNLSDNEKTWATVVSRQHMETVEAPYLEVTVQGTEPDAKTLLVTCHMDARSIVPEMSWGGDELWGVSAWLELVRWFRERPPKNHMRFVAFTGHWQDFAGSRHYVAEHLDEVGKEMPMVMGLDLSTEEKYLALVLSGWPQRGEWRGSFQWLEKLIWYFPAQPRQNWTDDIKAETGLRARLMGDQPPAHPWVGSQMGPEELHNPASLAGRSYVSSETWLNVGCPSIAWQTAELHRPHHFTPLDTFETSHVRRANLTGDDASGTGAGHVGQLQILFAFLDNISEIGAKYFPRGSAKRLGPDRSGYLEFHGQVKRYDEKTAWYKGGLPLDHFGAPLENTFVYMVPWDVRVRDFQQTVLAWHPLAPNKQKHRGMQSHGVRYLAKVDAEGRYRFPTVFYLNKFTRYTFVAFSLDDAGNILWAADLGRHGADEFKYLVRSVENWNIDQSITVFPCGSIALFDLYDRRRYNIGQNVKDTWYVQWSGVGQDHDEGVECYMPVSEVKLYPSQTDAKSYLIAQYRQTAMVFLPAQTPCEILMTRGVLKKFSLLRSLSAAPLPEALEARTTETAPELPPTPPEGPVAASLQGIRLEQGENRQVVNTPLVLARQMHLIDYDKKQHYDRFGVRSQEADVHFDDAARYITLAESNLAEHDETGFRANEAMAWRGESRAYQSIFRLLYDVVSTTIFYFTLLIPFSYLMERLLFPQKTYVRNAAVSGTVFLVFVLLLLKFHPGFRLAGNIYVTIVSFLIIVFTLPAFFMIIGAGMRMLKAAGSQYFQRHASEAERLGVLTAALSLSVANMRRRKLRTALTLGTISLLVLSLVLLTHTTSTSTTYPTKEPPRDVKVGYDGIQVFNTRYHTYALLRELVDLMENMYVREATVLPRWYGYYGIRTGLKGWESVRLYGPYEETDYHFYDLLGRMPTFRDTVLFPLRVSGDPALTAKVAEAHRRPKPFAEVPVIQFAAPDETRVTHIETTLLTDGAGKGGRWFTGDDVEAVILSDETAETIGAKVGDVVTLEEFRLKVVGVFDHGKMDALRDVTGEPILPIKFEVNQPTPEEPTRYKAARVLFMPLKFHERYDYIPAAPYSVVIVPHDKGRIKEMASTISKEFDNIDVYSATGGELNLISAFHTAEVTGGGLMVMPLVVSFLMIFSVMMGSVHERTREIYIFSSVGLSPRHVAGMFLIESIVYAGIASVWGYFLGIILLHVFRVEGMLPASFYPNYLGVFVIYSVGLAMLATISSSLYPMYKASRIANPSLERTWRIDTEPTDDRWDIQFPFISNQEAETRGILAFLKEFVEHHAGEGQGVFAVQGTVTYASDAERLSRAESRGHDHRLTFGAWLAPFERNVTQQVVFEARKDPARVRWTFHFTLTHDTGVRYMWVKSNKAFVDAFRKQMLVWRAFSEEVLAEYASRGRSLAGLEPQNEAGAEADDARAVDAAPETA